MVRSAVRALPSIIAALCISAVGCDCRPDPAAPTPDADGASTLEPGSSGGPMLVPSITEQPAAPTPDPVALSEARDESPIRRDEVVELFPTLAMPDADGLYAVEVHGWIYEPEEDDFLRGELLEELEDALDVDRRPPDVQARFRARAGRFLVDNERGKSLSAVVGDRVVELDPSDEDGHFFGRAELMPSELARVRKGNTVPIRIVTPEDDARAFEGHAMIYEPGAPLVISDIDDTVKITGVTDKLELMERTFLHPFEAVDGVGKVVSAWRAEDGALLFVSNSPYQLHAPLAQLLEGAHYDPYAVLLKRIRLRDESALELFADPVQTKLAALRPLLARVPKGPVVLLGDSGERDPEVYAAIAEEFSDRVRLVAIRDVSGEDASAPRYRSLFERLSVRLVVFRDPAELPRAIPEASR